MDPALTFQALLTRLPPDAGGRAVAVALVAAGAGLFLWLIGARVSRSVFTLLGVTAGAWAGVHLPRWMGWEIDSMAVAIGAALVLGLAGYLLHMLWVGLALGTLLASAGVFITWHRLMAGESWSMPSLDVAATASDLLRELWNTLPSTVSRAVPLVGGVCFATGALMATFTPKFARVLTFSLVGTLLLTVGGVAAVAIARPEWLAKLPTSTQTQGVALASIVMLGAAIQWALCPRVSKPAPVPKQSNAGAKPQAAEALQTRLSNNIRELASTPLGPLKPKEVRA